MFKIPLEQYRYPAGPHAVVELDDEGGRVRLVLELEPGELVGSYQQVEDHPPTVVDGRSVRVNIQSDDPLITAQQETGEVRAELRQREAVLDAVRKHRDYLKERLERVREEQDVSRDLSPSEARVAAALWHYADEVDAFGRRRA